MSTIIKIENLYKEYRLGVIGSGTLYWDLQSWWANVRGKEDPNTLIGHSGNVQGKNHILALDDINLEVREGEVLGIIGRNGAGKSTLLKILSRITAPSSGVVKGKGRIASLLEVGTGFHPELTGRENIYLNGAINGMDKKEVTKKLDEIVEFSGVGQFLDTPVKRYSTGMHVRLGFAVAAHLDPDILVVDEVLAVGDYDFQKKCISKMKDVSREEGRTVLFVSHNLGSVKELCSRAILLEKGRKIREGETGEVIAYYTSTAVQRNRERVNVYTPEKDGGSHLFENNFIRLNSVFPLNDAGEECNIFTVRDNIYVRFEYEIFTNKKLLMINVLLFSQRNEFVLYSYTGQNNSSFDEEEKHPGKYVSTCKIPGDFLNDGSYFVMVQLEDEFKIYFDEEVCFFDISDSKDPEGSIGYWSPSIRGTRWPRVVVVRPKLEWDNKFNSF